MASIKCNFKFESTCFKQYDDNNKYKIFTELKITEILAEPAILTLQRGVTSTARHSENATCRGVTSTARHAALSHSFDYISTTKGKKCNRNVKLPHVLKNVSRHSTPS